MDEIDLLTAAQTVDCKIDSFPIKYVGLPLATRKLSVNSWDCVVERFKLRLALWKGSVLSPAGGLILIKSVLLSDASSRALCKVSWKVICQDFDKEGLGLFNLHVRNQSLFFKWIWKLRFNNDNSLWANVISSCSSVCDWNFLLHGNVKNMSFIWKSIRKTCYSDSKAWKVFISNLKYNIGYGADVSLWNDNCLGNGSAIILFPRLYNLLNQKSAAIQNVWNGGWRWRRRLSGA
ncbi:uncharacterized protein LOC126678325 [Mercurialis annua]|uniref:uncharacterized protein LOC126678325 n=1 Tax=Mercurialis annua TaxID=3986 RepID=UPI00215FC476|nr:uncharacterized protein LOC126678325 [Mercurialis annua]